MPQAPKILKQLQAVLASVNPEQAEEEIQRIDAEIAALQEEQSTWRTLLGLSSQLRNAPENGTEPVVLDAGTEVPSIRQQILSVMNELPPSSSIRLGDLAILLRHRSWLTADKKDVHRLQMMASTLVKEGKLRRPRKGYYQLASGSSASEDALPDAQRNGETE